MAESIPLWVTLLGFAAPLIALAGSAVGYVVKIYQDAATRKRNEFFELMGFIDSTLPIATKIAAVYRLREFPEHKDFIIRFCESQRNNITGGGGHFLIAEMDATAAFFRKP